MTDAALDQVQQLLDLEALKQLKARYFRCLDTKDWAGWTEVFTEDVVMELPEADTVVDGRDAVVDGVSGALDGVRTVHHGHMPELELTGPDTARGIWAMFDYVEWPLNEDGSRNGMTGYGHYHEEYRREAGGWRISHLRLERLRTDPLV